MNKAFRTFGVIALAVTAPNIVVAQSNTGFDGTYMGVSNTATGTGSNCHPFEPMPKPLTIRDGIARFTGGGFLTGDVVFEGNVSTQGDLRMSDMFAHNLIGKIEPSGIATGSVSVGDTGCVLTAVWQRQ
jgi:hypothetical protein